MLAPSTLSAFSQEITKDPSTINSEPQSVIPLANPNIGYSVTYNNVPDGLLEKLKIISSLEKKNRPYPTHTAISRAARSDKTSFEQALKAAGYYQGVVDFSLETRKENLLTVIFTVTPGPLYRISDYKITYLDKVGDLKNDSTHPTRFTQFGLNPRGISGSRNKTVDGAFDFGAADGAALLNAQQAFLKGLWDNGFPSAKIEARRVIANPENATAIAQFEFSSGPKALFGAPVINGLTRTHEKYIASLLTYEIGALYNKSDIINYRDKLSQTGLFDNIDISPAATQGDGNTPVLINLTERKHRTIGAGAFYSTSEGPGGRIFYENRNLFKNAERFRAELEFSQIEQSVTTSLDKPLSTLPGSIFLQGAFINETTDAFDARTINITGGVSKFWFDQKLETRGGLALETSSVEPNNGAPQQRTFFVSAPFVVNWNNEDDFLNPTKGVRSSLLITPYTGTDNFTQIEATARTRYAFGARKRIITAFRGRVGATVGSDLEELPFNKRFFSGGGGSARGFGFQEAGPVEIQNNADGEIINVTPTGGRSVIEGAIEARYAFTNTIQGAAFIDTGSISQNAVPDFNEDFFVGVGAGIRYITPIGPLRIDIAVPLDRRPFDNRIQFLISLGQAF